ncbi:GatB/YqeY domain-containing protein [Phlegmacium glaucopus]|nr:GatB/YqeY domain-containing protein [Phlegmacium glaucopus]
MARCYSVLAPGSGLRSQIQSEIKVAMKQRDALTSTTLRSVLSEINASDKAAKNGLLSPDSVIADIIRKNIQRRTEAALKFSDADRRDLADKEQQEAELLSKFLPPLLSQTEIDSYIKEIMDGLPAGYDPRKSLGQVFKEFYLKVDKSMVDPTLVKQRAQVLLNSR